jgi:hypothetical protein
VTPKSWRNARSSSNSSKKDLEQTAQALKDCANDIKYLLRGELIGCPCQRIENDNTGASYLVYENACPHHSWLKKEEERLKAAYAKAETRLKRDVRYEIAKAALEGTAVSNPTMEFETVVKQSLRIADAFVAELTK